MKKDIRQALRMIGHLLEHHPTTGRPGRYANGQPSSHSSKDPKTSCWCLIGAQGVVSLHLGFQGTGRGLELYEALERCVGGPHLVAKWEGPGTTDQTRLEIARKLQNA